MKARSLARIDTSYSLPAHHGKLRRPFFVRILLSLRSTPPPRSRALLLGLFEFPAEVAALLWIHVASQAAIKAALVLWALESELGLSFFFCEARVLL